MTHKKNWVILRSSSPFGKSRVEIYKDEDSAALQSDPWRVVALELVSKVQMSSERKEFILVSPDDSTSFICASRADLDDWLRDLECVRRGGKGGKETFNACLPSKIYLKILLMLLLVCVCCVCVCVCVCVDIIDRFINIIAHSVSGHS